MQDGSKINYDPLNFMRDLWAFRPYRLLFSAGFLSELGTYVSEVALLLRIYELVGEQKQYIGITQGIFLILMILGTLLGGVFGEGKAKNQILVFCELARIPILLAMLTFSSSAWVLILGNGLVAFFSGAFNPTRQALMNEMLPPGLVHRANSLFSMSFAFLHALGPILGGLLYGSFQGIAPILLFDLATYFVGVALLIRLFLSTPHASVLAAEPAPSTSFLEDLQAGFELVRVRADFRWLMLRCVMASSALGIVMPLLLPMTTEVLHLPASQYGLLLGSFGLGGAVGSLVLPGVCRKLKVEALLRLLVLGEAFSLVAWAALAIPLLSFPLAFVYGAFLFARITSQLNFVSRKLPPEFNARANSLLDLAMVLPSVLGAGIVALAGEQLDTAELLQWTAVSFSAAVWLSCFLEFQQAQKRGCPPTR